MAEGLAAINAEARAAGMSYGRYMAMRAASEKPAAKALPLEVEVEPDPKCLVCGVPFERKRRGQVCCSPVCQDARRDELNRIRNVNRYRAKHGGALAPRACDHCGKVFLPEHARKVLCSDACRQLRQNEQARQRRAARKEVAKREDI